MGPIGSARIAPLQVAGLAVVAGRDLTDNSDGPPLLWIQARADGPLWLGSSDPALAPQLRELAPGESVRFRVDLRVQADADGSISPVVELLRRLERRPSPSQAEAIETLDWHMSRARTARDPEVDALAATDEELPF